MSTYVQHRHVFPKGTFPLKKVPPKPEKSIAVDEDCPRGARPIVLPSSSRTLSLSPRYSQLSDISYLEQCFDNVQYLAEGSFGIVYQAKSKDDGKYYAVKKFKRRFNSQESSHRACRLGEVERYAKIPRSKFCVELIRAWEEKQYLYVQMELCSVTLTQFAARNDCVNEDVLWKILLHVLLAVRHLHVHHFAHLDIKPDNILVSSDNTFKLADFGLMVDLSKGPVNDAQDGDARYLAPEVLKAVYTEAADIFSLGLTMYELGCAIQLPSHGRFWHQLRSGNLPFQPFICQSVELFELIKSMTAVEPQERPSVEKLLKCRKLQKMNRGHCVQTLFHGVAATLKSFCTLSKTAAVNCGLSVFKPFASRVCPVLWKKEQTMTITRQQEPLAVPGTSHSQTETDNVLFRARLAACKKRLTFDDDEDDCDDSCQPSTQERMDACNECTAGAKSLLSTAKRRRLFD